MKIIFSLPSKPVVRLLLVSGLSFVTLHPASGEEARISREQAEALVAGLHFQHGEIGLQDGLATLRVPEGFRFLNGSGSNTVLVKLWGNPPSPKQRMIVELGLHGPGNSPLYERTTTKLGSDGCLRQNLPDRTGDALAGLHSLGNAGFRLLDGRDPSDDEGQTKDDRRTR